MLRPYLRSCPVHTLKSEPNTALRFKRSCSRADGRCYVVNGMQLP